MIRVFGFFALVAALLLYGNALHAPFQLDDQQVLAIAEQGHWATRPAGYASFRASAEAFNVFSGVLPWKPNFYHRLFNVAVHAMAATALFWLALELTGGKLLVAWLAGVFFLVHPIQTQANVYVSQRFESLAALFMFLAAAAYMRFRTTKNRYWLVFLVGSVALAGTAKETAIVLPLWLLVLEAVFFGRLEIRRRLIYVLPLGLILAIPAWRAFQSAGKTFAWVGLDQYWLTQGPVLAKYLGMSVWPGEQFLLYDFPLAESMTWVVAAKWAVVLGVAGFGILLSRRQPLIGFGILTFFVLLLPILVLPIPDLIFEHRLYPALAGLALAAAAAVGQARSKPVVAVACAMAIVWSTKTLMRNAEWNDDITFWEAHYKRFPENPAILVRLGSYYFLRGFVNRGLELTQEARRHEDRFNLYYRQNGQTNIAINLAFLYMTKGDLEAGKREALRALAMAPSDPIGLQALATAYLNLKDFEKSRDTYRKLTEMRPSNTEAWAGLALSMSRLGDREGAKAVSRQAEAEEAKARDSAGFQLTIPTKYKTYAIFTMTILMLAGLFLAVRTTWTVFRQPGILNQQVWW